MRFLTFCPLKNKQQIKVISAYFLNIFVKAPLRFVIETQNISKHEKKQEICNFVGKFVKVWQF